MNIVKKLISLVLLLAVSLTLDASKTKKHTPKAMVISVVKTQSPARARAEAKKKRRDTKKTLEAIEAAEAAELAAALAASSVEDLPRPLRFYEETIAPIAPVVGHESTQEPLTRLCDEINREQCLFEGDWLIKQVPGLYQSYPLLEERYGENYNTLCGFYALHFALVFAANPTSSPEEFTQRLNDRNTFDAVLRPWRNTLRLAGRPDFDIYGQDIQYLLPVDMQEHVFVDGSFAEEASAEVIERIIVHRQTLVDAFKDGDIDHVIFICPTRARGGHWITVLVRRTADNNVEIIICDSAAIDRRQNESLMGLYADLINQ